MRISFNKLWADKIIKQSIIGSLVLFVLSTIYLLLLFKSFPPYIPLYNQLPWGVERLGDKLMIFLPSVVVFVLFLMNMLIARWIYERMPLVARMIGITSFFISFVTFIFIIRITLLIL